jgi:hypothetical protein
MTDDVLRGAVLFGAGLLALWTAFACRRAQDHGYAGADAFVWAGLSAVFFLLCLFKTVRGLGMLQGFGAILRDIFKQKGWYEDRRTLQIAATVAVTATAFGLLVWGVRWSWHFLKRYRLAVGFAALSVGFAAVRFISLHEVDAWTAEAVWVRTTVDLIAASGVSAVALARLRQLRKVERKISETL